MSEEVLMLEFVGMKLFLIKTTNAVKKECDKRRSEKNAFGHKRYHDLIISLNLGPTEITELAGYYVTPEQPPFAHYRSMAHAMESVIARPIFDGSDRSHDEDHPEISGCV